MYILTTTAWIAGSHSTARSPASISDSIDRRRTTDSSGMASLVLQPRRSIQTYWARRNYQRLGSPSRHLRVARLGGGAGGKRSGGGGAAARRRLRWVAGLRVLLLSPGRVLARLREAYVDAMLALAGGAARPCAALASSKAPRGEGGAAALWAKRVPRARSAARSGDFERRMMEHIYNVIVTPELPGGAAKA